MRELEAAEPVPRRGGRAAESKIAALEADLAQRTLHVEGCHITQRPEDAPLFDQFTGAVKLVNYAIMPMENWRAREAELAYYREHVPELRNDKARLDWLPIWPGMCRDYLTKAIVWDYLL